MVFEIKNKVALVTGGASGIGLALVKEFLKQGAKGVTIADVNLKNGEKVLKNLKEEFGENRLIFVLTDVSHSTNFENAFKATTDKFKSIDILINNAGIDKDSIWEQEIEINLKGTINGMILGLEKYLRDFKQGGEAVILNISSITALTTFPVVPIYSATKEGILALTRCWGHDFHYERTKVRVMAICAGVTNTPILNNIATYSLMPEYQQFYEEIIATFGGVIQSPEFFAEEALKLLKAAPNGSIWVVEESKPAYQYILPDKNSFESNILK